MKNRVLNQVALAFTILSVIAFAVAFSPAVLAIILSVGSLVLALFGIVVFFIGGLVSLIMISNPDVWAGVKGLALGSWSWAGRLFDIIPPMARFCFEYMAPICGGIGIGFGVIALVLSIISLAKHPKGAEETDGSAPAGDAQENAKSAKKKKKKTERSRSIVCLVLSIVFTVLNVIGLIAVHFIMIGVFA